MAAEVITRAPELANPSSVNGDATQFSIIDEVKAAQEVLRSRLAGAVTKPPPNVSEAALPSVPLIDLSPSFSNSVAERKQVAAQIRDACCSSGFFQISNHGVSESAMNGILQQAERFFHDLDSNQKEALHIRHTKLFRGYEAGGDTYVNPDDIDIDKREAETKEGFNWGYEASLDPSGGDGKYVELDGEPQSKDHGNVWPSEDVLPGFKEGVAEYYSQVLSLARHLFRLFALSFGIEETYFDSLITHPGGIGRLLYYPPQSAAALAHKESKIGLGAHTDYECFTLLLSSAEPGLEILFPPSELTGNKPLWRPCPVRPGTLTVNVADFLMRWTNGLYKSTIHRVVSRPVVDQKTGGVKGSEARYSVPFFFSINYDADVEPLPESAVGKSVFQNMKAGEYILERLRATV